MKNFNKQSTLFRLMMSMVFFSTMAMAQIEPAFRGCIHEPCGPELVTNGDFEAGKNAFIRSDYTRVYQPTGCKTFAIEPNAAAFHPGQWATEDDHTFGSDNVNDTIGLFFIGDAPCNNATERAWYEYVTVQPNVTYVFSAWVSNLNSQNNHNNSAFQLYANGQALLNNPVIVAEEGTWTRICAEYVGTDYISMEVAIMVTPTATFDAELNEIIYVGSGGADFGLDDISFRAASPGDPAFTYVQASGCKNEAISFTANTPIATHQWDFGTINASPSTSTDPNPVVSYALAGTYPVKHSITDLTRGCTETYLEYITIKDCDVIKACNTGFTPCGPNLAVNGDFEAGNTSIYSDLDYVQSPGGCAKYSVVYDAHDFHPGHWFTRDDHTYGADAVNNDNTGQFFVGDAQCDATIRRAWYQNVNVTQGETYIFSAWVSNLGDTKYTNITAFYLNAGGLPLLTNPIAVPSVGNGGGDARWTKICAQYVAATTGSIEISINVLPTDGLGAASPTTSVTLLGADFGIDDISFASLNYGDAQFTYTSGTNCEDQPVSFTSTTQTASHTWDFGTNSATPSTSSDPNPVVIYSVAGTYTVKHRIYDESTGCSSTYISEITIEDCPTVGACNTELITCGYNLVQNGDFENGDNDFDSDYELIHSPGGCAKYAVVYNAYIFHPGHWFTRDDHTYGPDNIERDSIGQFFIGDAQCNAQNVRYRAWYQDIDVAAGEVYVFSAWVSNLDRDIYNNKAAFNLVADGTPLLAQPFVITSIGTGNTEGRWSQICGEFVATTTGTIEISIDVIPSVELTTASSSASLIGADFGLDDISFMGVATGDAGFIGLNGAPCTKTVNFIANEQSPNWYHIWGFGDGNGSNAVNPSHTYLSGGTYTVTHGMVNTYTGCRVTTTQEITVLDCLPKCEIESDFNVRSYFVSPLASNIMDVEFEAQPITNSITHVTGYSWTSTGVPNVGTGATFNSSFSRLTTSETSLVFVNLCVYGLASDPDLGLSPVTTCSDCDCKVYDVAGNSPRYVRPCTPREVEQLLDIPLPRVAGEVEEKQAIKVIAAPNPFNNNVSINMEHLNGTDLKMEVYDLTGRLVETLFNGQVDNNQFQYRWSPQGNLQEGVYLLKIQNGGTLINHKLFYSK